MPRILLKSVSFSKKRFRKLRNMTIPIGERITVISGHNGIGKSTILGLIANASGLTARNFRSYFNRRYMANFQELFSLTNRDFQGESEDERPYVELMYEVDGESITKRCNVSRQEEPEIRFRIVPRNFPLKELEIFGITIGRDAKVPIPTLYLGMSRVIPIGESQPNDVVMNRDLDIPEEDAAYIERLNNRLIDTGLRGNIEITHQNIKRTKKLSKLPSFNYDSKSISLGQDSLSSIVTALASFKKLKREQGDEYRGGILVIDEIDAGFHPRTQNDLIDILKSEARQLSLQIVVTTHSLVLIEKIFKENKTIPEENQKDKIAYLMDTRSPQLRLDMSFEDIRRDMYLLPPLPFGPRFKIVKIYTEDEEAKFVLGRIVREKKLQRKLKSDKNIKIEIISAGLGDGELINLYKADSYFQSVVIVLDGDASNRRSTRQQNLIKLPRSKADIKQSPESILYHFCRSLVENRGHEMHEDTWNDLAAQPKNCPSDYIHHNFLILHDIDITDKNAKNTRLRAKNWFKEMLPEIKRLELVDLWLRENDDMVTEFSNLFVKTIEEIAEKNKRRD